MEPIKTWPNVWANPVNLTPAATSGTAPRPTARSHTPSSSPSSSTSTARTPRTRATAPRAGAAGQGRATLDAIASPVPIATRNDYRHKTRMRRGLVALPPGCTIRLENRTSFWDFLEWKMPIFCGSEVWNTTNASQVLLPLQHHGHLDRPRGPPAGGPRRREHEPGSPLPPVM